MTNRQAVTSLDVMELFYFYLARWKLALLIMAISLIIGVTYYSLARPMYRAQITVQYIPISAEAGLLGPGTGLGLALAGLQGDRAMPERAKAFGTMRSRTFIVPFIERNGLAPELYPDRFEPSTASLLKGRSSPTPGQLYGAFTGGVLSVDDNASSGLVTLSFFASDPTLAAKTANSFISDLNQTLKGLTEAEARQNIDYLNRQMAATQVPEIRAGIARLIESEMRRMVLASSSAASVFKVIDPATAPDGPHAPRRLLVMALALIVGFLAGLLAISVRFVAAKAIQ